MYELRPGVDPLAPFPCEPAADSSRLHTSAMSDFDDLRDDAAPAAAHPGEADAAVSVAGDSTAAAPVNPRKRKKSSRALVLLVPCQLFILTRLPTHCLALCSASVLPRPSVTQPNYCSPTHPPVPQPLVPLMITGVEPGHRADLGHILAVTSAM